jgi:hypothetical protein
MTSVIKSSLAGGEVSPAVAARVDLQRYQSSLKTCKNFMVMAHGGVKNRPGFEFVTEVKDSTKAVRLIPFEFNTLQTYILEFGNLYIRVIKDGEQVLEANKTITGITQANPAVVTSASHGFSNGDEVYISGVVGMTQVNGLKFIVAGATANTFQLTGINSTGYTAYSSGGTAARVFTLVTPYVEADLFDLSFVQSADVMTICHPTYAPRDLTRTGHAAWTLTAITFAPSVATPTGQATAVTGSTGTTYSYKITAVDEDTLDESLPTAAVTASAASTLNTSNYVTITWTDPGGTVGHWNVYKLKGGSYGFIGKADLATFKDDGITAETSDSPPEARNPFNATGDYPSVTGYYQQRKLFANTDNKPQTVWFSRTGNYANMSVSTPTKDDDAITASIAARQVNEIRHLVPLTDMIVLTSGGEWKISGVDKVITPSSIRIEPQGYRGATKVPPVIIGNTVLYIQRGELVRDLGYAFESDSYTGNDLSVLARHLFDGYSIADWTYALSPDSIVWAVRSDGTMLALTYMREHEVWGWHRHTTDGTFESVASVAEGDENAVYVVVRRNIGGANKRYIERLHTRVFSSVEDCFFLDCALTYDGAAADEISGLDHLNGETVSALADGNVITGLTVTNGTVTLPYNASVVHVGLPYTCEIETLNLDAGGGGETIQGKKKRISNVTVRVEESRGMWVGPDSDHLREYKQRATEAYNAPIALATGDFEIILSPSWNSNGRIVVQQNDPLPLTILSIIPEVVIGG